MGVTPEHTEFIQTWSGPTITLSAAGELSLGEGVRPDEAAHKFLMIFHGHVQRIGRAAAAEERESCAKIADAAADLWASLIAGVDTEGICRTIARAIRARGQ